MHAGVLEKSAMIQTLTNREKKWEKKYRKQGKVVHAESSSVSK